MRLSFHRLAEQEFNDATDCYERESPGLGRAFVLEVEHCAAAVLIHPDASAAVRGRIRRRLVRRFPYALLYLVKTDEIRIVAVRSCRPPHRNDVAACDALAWTLVPDLADAALAVLPEVFVHGDGAVSRVQGRQVTTRRRHPPGRCTKRMRWTGLVCQVVTDVADDGLSTDGVPRGEQRLLVHHSASSVLSDSNK